MNNRNIEELIEENESLKKEIEALKNSKGHMSTIEIVTDLALMLCAALLFTIISYVSGAYGEGFFEVIKNAFAWIF